MMGRGRIFMSVKQPLPVRLRLYDASGRLEEAREIVGARGAQALELGGPRGQLKAGVHFLEVSQGRQRAVRKLVVVQ